MNNIILLNNKFEPSLSHSIYTILKMLHYVTLYKPLKGIKVSRVMCECVIKCLIEYVVLKMFCKETNGWTGTHINSCNNVFLRIINHFQ
jgi:hypothetical protein